MVKLKSALLIVLIAVLSSTLVYSEPQQKVTLRVDGLACPFCAYGMEKKLKRLDNLEKLDIKINEGLVILSFKEGAKIDKEVISKKVKEAGFTPREITVETPVAESDAESQKVALKIEGMRCQGCVSRVETALKNIACVKEVSVSLEKNEATVLCTGAEKDREKLVDAVNELGFKAKLVKVGKD